LEGTLPSSPLAVTAVTPNVSHTANCSTVILTVALFRPVAPLSSFAT